MKVWLRRRPQPACSWWRAEAGMVPVVDDLYFSTDSELLERWLQQQKSERELRLYAGHAGWGPGQLTREFARGDWHVLPATAAQVFDAEVESLWQRLIERAPAPEIEVRAQGRMAGAATWMPKPGRAASAVSCSRSAPPMPNMSCG
jgi:hypothetical protein